jgi:hypothetical protein
MPTINLIELTKADVVERQLNTAIWLWFHDQDAVSIQALASGALKVCHDVGAKSGKPSDFITLASVPPEHRDEIKRLLKEPQDFFKHAKGDPDAVIKFHPIISEYFLYETITLTQQVFGRFSISMFTFGAYFRIHRPELFPVLFKQPDGLRPVTNWRELAKVSREEFFSRLVTHFALVNL